MKKITLKVCTLKFAVLNYTSSCLAFFETIKIIFPFFNLNILV